ncbi:plasmid mobilization protein [Levilactobacillus tongjiangensis]|uniref:Type II toxin-antitoxin system RelB/DinJ family antitoxin n=1 Tax=Levilactobacillus tongjiangensis TaxID=2486023 RepID=A0ABW1SU75_9LACO|nr:type II toxin-antitoxin system RelB/DinJ family antitoxin [Levilactobacillus tongjiangensis]
MPKTKVNTESITFRLSPTVKKIAQQKIEESGLTLSEYLRLSMIQIANDGFNDFLSTDEALAAKKEVENGQLKRFDSFDELWADLNDEN